MLLFPADEVIYVKEEAVRMADSGKKLKNAYYHLNSLVYRLKTAPD
jgi:hypothetical protein